MTGAPDRDALPLAGAVLDLDALAALRQLGLEVHDVRFVNELVEQFVADTDVRLVAMRAAIGGGDPGLLGRLTHALQGAAGQLGGDRLVAACTALEDAGDAASTEVALGAVEREYAALRSALIEQVDERAERPGFR